MHGDVGWQKKTASILRTMWFLGLEFWFEFDTKFTPNLFIASIAYVHAGFNSGWCVVRMWVLLVCIVVVVEFPNECSLPDLPPMSFAILRPIRPPKPSLMHSTTEAISRHCVFSLAPLFCVQLSSSAGVSGLVFPGKSCCLRSTTNMEKKPSHFRYTL